MSLKPSIRRIGMLAVLVAVLAGGVLAWQRMRPAELPPGFASGNGRLEATEVDVSTKLAGRVATLLPHEGDAVVGGAVVAGLDMADLAAQLNQAEAQILQAKSAAAQARAALPGLQSQVELARVTLERTRQLVAKNFITGDKLDRDSSALKSAQAALEAGRAQVKVADAAVTAAEAGARRMRSVLDDATLKAPISGRVLYRLVEPGEVLGAGGKLLTLLDLSDVFMTVYLPAGLVGRIAIGAEARIALDALPGEWVPAKVAFVSDKAQFTPREVETRSEREKLMFRVKVRVDAGWLAGHLAQVKPGMPGVALVRLDPAAAWPERLPGR